MKGAARRLSAVVEAMRGGGGNAAQEKMRQKELVQALIALQRYWKPELLTNPTRAKKRSSKSNAALFQLLVAALTVYSGSHTAGLSAGLAGSGAGISSSANTSECVHRLVCDMLVRCFDFSVVSSINDTLMSKNAPLYIKVSLIMVVCRLPLQEALQFLPDVMTLTNKNIRAADYYMKQCLLESLAHALKGESMRLTLFHPEALKIVNKIFQDKVPEVRIAASRLLYVLAERTSSSVTSSAGSGGGGCAGTGSGNGSRNGGAGNTTPTTAKTSGGGSSANSYGISLDAILQITAKGMDDIAPEARRAYSVVVGVVLAEYATSSSRETEIHSTGGDSYSAITSSLGNNDEDAGGKASVESDMPSYCGAGKAKTGFKLHVPGMTSINLPSSLSRRKAAIVNFLTVADVILHLKEMVTSKYISNNRDQRHGGILASFSIALTSMFERLPPDSIAENQLRDVMNAILAILDYPFALGDLTRARNAVGFVLRYGLSRCLSERQQQVLLGVYLQRLQDENQISMSNHHKMLSVLVEVSHLFHSLGEVSVTRALDACETLQGLICHEKQSVRFQAAIALASLVTAVPYQLKNVLTNCIHGLQDTAKYLMRGGSDVEDSKKSEIAEKAGGCQDEENEMQSKALLYAIQGRSAAIVHILRAIEIDTKEGISQTIMNDIFTISEELVESQFLNDCPDSIWLTCTRAGWTLVSSLVSINCEQWFKANLEKLLNLWLKSSVLHSRESSLELLRIEAAAITLSSFLSKYQDLAMNRGNDVNLLANHVLHAYLTATQDKLSKPLKRRGQLARHRLMGWIVRCFSMLPPIFSDSYIVLLDLIAESTTAQALTNLRHSSQVPAKSTYLRSVLSSDDNTLDIVTISRLEVGDCPSPLYSRELNHVLGLLLQENTLTDTELELQYSDIFRRSVAEKYILDDATAKESYSLSIDVRLVDACVVLFGRLFHFIPEDLQLRCLQHYAAALTDLRVDCEVNVCSLLFSAIAEARRLEVSGAAPTLSTSLSATSWPLKIQTMLCELISSENAEVRRGAGEALGTIAFLLGEDSCRGLLIELEKRLVVDKLPQGACSMLTGSNIEPDVSIVSTGAAFALACIKRACGFRITLDTGLILRFSSVCSQPLRTWILHSWGMILESANSTGGEYEQYLSSTLSLMDAHILAGFVYSKVNQCNIRWQISAKVALGRIINDVVAALGPELEGSSDRLDQFYSLWLFLRQDGDARVELEFLRFLEQVVVFAPSRFQCADLVYILRIISDSALINSATSTSSGHLFSSSPSYIDRTSPLNMGAYGEQLEQNDLVGVGVFTNGWSRSILQSVGLSCIRTLVERDPALIRRHNLFCLLFSALHVEYNELLWGYLPGLHGMWDALSFAQSTVIQRNSVNALRNTALALLEVECRDHEGAEPCLWALLFRSIAIGESASTIVGANADQLMVSPKGTNSMPANFDPSGDEDTFSWNQVIDVRESDASSLKSAAVVAQMDTWRSTKARVGELVTLMPPLSRQVRHFAVECVLHVFQLIARIPPQAIGTRQLEQRHFDLVLARRYYFDMLSARAARSVSTSTNIITGNFLCMYVDEFVTLACQVTTTSAEGDELLMFQCVGLQLLNVLVKNFASARDPEVITGDAYLLDPYRAQITSAIRHALTQVQVKPTSFAANNGSDKSEKTYFYAPLFLEAHSIAGACISAHLIQDKVGLGRILRAVMTYDYGHAHFIGDDITRSSISLANLASIGELLTSSINEAIAQKNARDDESTAIGMSPLVKAVTNGLSGTTEYLFKCWIDATFCYVVVMQGCAQWAQFDAAVSAALLADQSMVLPALQMPLPPMGHTKNVLVAASSTTIALRGIYKRYWPKIVNTMAVLQVHMPKFVSLCSSTKDKIQWSIALFSSAVYHVNANVRDRMEDERELPAVFRSIPLLLRVLANSPSEQSDTSSTNFPVLLMTAVDTLVLASKRCSGSAQVAALTAMFSCLSRENLNFAGSICRSKACGEDLRAKLFTTVAQAALCPTEVVCQLCDVTERHARAVSSCCSTTEPRHDFVGYDENSKYMTEIVQLATTGIVFLHTTEEARTGAVLSVAMVQQIVCSVASYNSSALKEAVVTLHRASTESVLALARTLERNDDSADDTLTRINCSVRDCFELLVEWLKVDMHSAPGFSLQIVANYAVSFPTSLLSYADYFHVEIAKMASSMLDGASGEYKQQQAAISAEVLRGLQKNVTKLIDVNQTGILNRYMVALGPCLVQIVGGIRRHPSTAAELDEMDQAEKLLRVLTTQLNEEYGSKFVHMLLPRLVAVLSYQIPSDTDSLIAEKVSSILGRLLLCFAQTYVSAFKEAVAAMTPPLRGILETTLRLALVGSVSGAGVRTQSSVLQGPPATRLDLSQYA
ncbi:hypothetical protein PsorP6_003650 [Peronosclerospora sorghi]|uniref:Uncharacterized protein n=1 Tax=Peronosclerospora sorghi TaxID=230839 RepID=A0ACC0VRG1_9STRA|nr:hypothetical protein PsorP6_003650 [Peronosclerospora sorghi]